MYVGIINNVRRLVITIRDSLTCVIVVAKESVRRTFVDYGMHRCLQRLTVKNSMKFKKNHTIHSKYLCPKKKLQVTVFDVNIVH